MNQFYLFYWYIIKIQILISYQQIHVDSLRLAMCMIMCVVQIDLVNLQSLNLNIYPSHLYRDITTYLYLPKQYIPLHHHGINLQNWKQRWMIHVNTKHLLTSTKMWLDKLGNERGGGFYYSVAYLMSNKSKIPWQYSLFWCCLGKAVHNITRLIIVNCVLSYIIN